MCINILKPCTFFSNQAAFLHMRSLSSKMFTSEEFENHTSFRKIRIYWWNTGIIHAMKAQEWTRKCRDFKGWELERPRDSLLPAHSPLTSCLLFFLSATFSLSGRHALRSYMYGSITREDLEKPQGKILSEQTVNTAPEWKRSTYYLCNLD